MKSKLLLCLLIIPFLSNAQRYIHFKTHTMDHGVTTRIHVSMVSDAKDPIVAKDILDYHVFCKIYRDYNLSNGSLKEMRIPLTTATIKDKKGAIVFGFDIPKFTNTRVVVELELRHKHNGDLFRTYFDVFNQDRFRYKYAIYKSGEMTPHFSNYVKKNDSFTIKDHLGTITKLYVTKFAHDFGPSKSPMDLQRSPKGGMKIDSSFTIQSGELITDLSEGLYLVRDDLKGFYGIGFRVVNDDYPKLAKVQQLIPPLTYISTKEEIKKLASDATKEQIDRYWLQLLNANIPLARKTIKGYYQNIKKSNIYFSTFKEGWKTDMGMVHAVFGYPSTIQYAKDVVQWTYTKQKNTKNTISFTFKRRNNQFTDTYYALDRYIEYEPLWYPVIEHWRNGSIQIK